MYVQSFFSFFVLYYWNCGPGSSVGIANGYGLDGPGIQSRRGWDFPHLSRQALGPTQPPVQWVPGLSWGKERSGRDADPSPLASAVGHERVELYLYSPYGPYGFYRASVPVQGCTLLLHVAKVRADFPLTHCSAFQSWRDTLKSLSHWICGPWSRKIL